MSEAERREIARQLDAALAEERGMRERLLRVHHRLAVANADLCGTTAAPALGVSVANPAGIGDELLRQSTARVYGLTSGPALTYVVPGGAAARAGLRPGDTLVAVDDRPAPPNGGTQRWLRKTLHEEAAGSTRRVIVERNGRRLALSIVPDRACDYPVDLKTDDRINALANGRRITVTTGMMRFVRSDEELALVLGHEMAHNILRHPAVQEARLPRPARQTPEPAGALTGDEALTKAYDMRRRLEAEADYHGIYYAARAGYAVSAMPALWRRMATVHPNTITRTNLAHPTSVTRFLALDATAREILTKQADGQPLTPEPPDHADH